MAGFQTNPYTWICGGQEALRALACGILSFAPLSLTLPRPCMADRKTSWTEKMCAGIVVPSVLAWSAVIVILIVACVAGWEAHVARLHQREAEREAELAFARQLAAQAEVLQLQHGSYLPLSLLLAAESMRRTPSAEGEFIMRRGIGLLPRPIAWLPIDQIPMKGPARPSPCGWSLLASKVETKDERVDQIVCISDVRKKAVPLITNPDLRDGVFSANGEIFGYRDTGDIIRFVDLTSGREVWHLHVDELSAFVMSRTAQYVGVQTLGPSGQSIEAYRFGNSAPVFQKTCNCTGDAFAISDDGSLMAASVGYGKPVEMIWNIRTHRSGKTVPAESYIRSRAEFSQDNAILAVTDQLDLVLWDLTAQRVNRRFHHDGAVTAMAFSPDGKSVATASLDHTARLWSLTSGEELLRIVHDDGVVSVSFSADGKQIFTSGFDRRIALWESSAGQKSGQILRRDQATDALTDAFGGVANAVLGPPAGQVTVVSPDGRYALLYDFSDFRAYLTSVPDKKHLLNLGEAFSVKDRAGAFTGDSLYFLMITPDGHAVEVRHVPDGSVVATLRHPGKVEQFALTKDSSTAITISRSSAYLWSIPIGRPISVLPHEHDVRSAIFSPDETVLATLSEDDVLRVWNWREAAELARIVPYDNPEDARFSADGRYIEMTFSGDRSGRWPWKLDDLVAEACSRLPHNMTRDEWRQYFGTRPYQKTCPSLQ